MTFCTISFKFAIGPNISKEFLRSIDIFFVQFLSNLRSVLIFHRNFLRSITKIHCTRSIASFSRNCTINKPIDRKNFFEILGPIASLKEIVQKVHVMLSMVYVIVIMIVIILLLLCFMWVGKKFVVVFIYFIFFLLIICISIILIDIYSKVIIFY